MASNRGYVWSSIEDLPRDWRELSDRELHGMVEAWQEQAESMRQSRAYSDFLGRLQREWAIETGQIERLYSIREGATKTLIEQGLDAALLSHEDTDQPPERVIEYIKDQYNAIEGLYQFVGGDRALTTSYVRELHRVLTAHQTHYMARDTLGNYVERVLPRGEWKQLPNNVEFEDGTIFEFCPPVHVDSEMDRLLHLYHAHESLRVPLEVESAWLHHRFTLIHPFTDGNGRVARCLSTLVFLKGRWFPLVVTRDDRVPYMSALRAADRGDLAPLVDLFASLQKRAIQQALSLSEDVSRGDRAFDDILSRVEKKFQTDRARIAGLEKKVFHLGDHAWNIACDKLETTRGAVQQVISGHDPSWLARVISAENESDSSSYNRFQIVSCAKSLGYYANLDSYRAWVKLSIVTAVDVELLFAFHAIGREFRGILVCAAMAYVKRRHDEANGKTIDDLVPLASEPFRLAYTESLQDVDRRFQGWVDGAVIEGLDYWRNAIGA
jgi:Fic family protein